MLTRMKTDTLNIHYNVNAMKIIRILGYIKVLSLSGVRKSTVLSLTCVRGGATYFAEGKRDCGGGVVNAKKI